MSGRQRLRRRGGGKAAGPGAVMTAVDERLKQGNYYEASQMIKASALRHQSKGRKAAAVALLVAGAERMGKYGHLRESADLADIVLEIFGEHGMAEDSASLTTLAALAQALPTGCPEHVGFLNAALRWSKQAPGGDKRGAPELHHLAGQAQAQALNLPVAAGHYRLAHQPEAYAELLMAWAKHGPCLPVPPLPFRMPCALGSPGRAGAARCGL